MLCTLSTSGRNKRSSIPVVLRFDIKKEKKKKNERRGINYRHGNFLPISAKHRVIHRATKCHDRTLFLRNGGEKKEEEKKCQRIAMIFAARIDCFERSNGY